MLRVRRFGELVSCICKRVQQFAIDRFCTSSSRVIAHTHATSFYNRKEEHIFAKKLFDRNIQQFSNILNGLRTIRCKIDCQFNEIYF